MTSRETEYLECERHWVFWLLMFVAGFYGVYTFLLRGGVFCNAQTANFVLFAIELGNKSWYKAAYYFIPMTAYMAGAFVSEAVALRLTKVNFLRWETILVAIEIIFIIALGFVPDSAPYQISQVAINFICSMQYNTFRQAEGIPMATTFCTNQLRQVGVGFAKALRKHDREGLSRALFFLGMLGCFFAGGVLSTLACHLVFAKAIWLNLLPLGIVLVRLVHADLTEEKGLLSQKPAGH